MMTPLSDEKCSRKMNTGGTDFKSDTENIGKKHRAEKTGK